MGYCDGGVKANGCKKKSYQFPLYFFLPEVYVCLKCILRYRSKSYIPFVCR